MQLSAYSTYKRTVQLQRALREARRRDGKVAADGWQVARGWGEAGALRARGGALAHAGRCSRLGKSKIELAREGRQIWSTTNGQRAQAVVSVCVPLNAQLSDLYRHQPIPQDSYGPG